MAARLFSFLLAKKSKISRQWHILVDLECVGVFKANQPLLASKCARKLALLRPNFAVSTYQRNLVNFPTLGPLAA